MIINFSSGIALTCPVTGSIFGFLVGGCPLLWPLLWPLVFVDSSDTVLFLAAASNACMTSSHVIRIFSDFFRV